MKTNRLLSTLVLLTICFTSLAQKKKDYEIKIDTVNGKAVRYADFGDGTYEEMKKSKLLTINRLQKEHEIYASNEKTFLKEQIERINERVKNGKMTEEKATEFKRNHAQNVADRIMAHKTKTEAEIEFAKITTSLVSPENIDVSVNIDYRRKYQKEIKTTSRLTAGSGYNFMTGDNLSIDDFGWADDNAYISFGYQWQTAISKNQKWRFNYGITYQSHKTELNGGRIFSPNTDQTQLVGIGFDTNKAIFRQDQLVFPLNIEFGSTSKKEFEDGRIRYNQRGKWKAGMGGFVGFNMSSRIKLKYEQNGRKIKQTTVNAFDTNPWVYGVDAFVGYGNYTLFGRMNLNNVFKSGSVDAQYVSFGIRLQ